MKRETIQVGTFEVNCSFLTLSEGTYVIDPGSEGARIIELCAQKKFTLAGILLTHAHFDHIGAVNDLQRAFPDLPVYLGAKDHPLLTHPLNQFLPDYPSIVQPTNLRDAATLTGIEVLATPGHTPGGVCYYLPKDHLLFSGDTLFAGSVGRTDLPGGNMKLLMSSLRQLRTLPDETHVVPGHGPETTLSFEKEANPFLQVE